MVVYRRPPPCILAYGEDQDQTANGGLEQQLQNCDRALAVLNHLTLAQNQMKKFADLHRRELEFQVGDLVFLKIQPYRQHSLAKKRWEKLS